MDKDILKGLTEQEAAAQLKAHGYNEISVKESKNILKIAKEVFKEPILALLIVCAGLYILIGDHTEGFILLGSILFIVAITFYQYRKTEKALDALKKLSSPRALVIRDGIEKRISGREVVPGDCIKLNEGDRVPADAIITESAGLTIDESVLTGESLPVKKSNEAQIENSNRIFSGTLVVQGRCFAKVTATGIHTEFGKIGVSLGSIEEESTKLQSEIKKLNKNLIIIGICCTITVTILFFATRGNFINSLLYGLSSAMALMPEEFPMAMIIFLALGGWRLSKKNVLTRKPAVIETLGSATVLCCDKTGTITQNKMEVVAISDPVRSFSKEEFAQQKTEIESIISAAHFASLENSSDPMELAISKIFKETTEENQEHILLKEYELTKELLAMSRVLKNTRRNQTKAFSKGAPETIFKLCRLNEKEIEKYNSDLIEMAKKGLRILGVAETIISENSLPTLQSEFKFKFLGLVGFEDPIRKEVPQAVKECQDAGVKVIMITGDFPVTAENIARQIGLKGENIVMAGAEMDQINEQDFIEKIKHIQVFARVVPVQKLRIVNALKANGEIVAMTGDGVNDAPALKAANIGISMGIKGTDVAREASSLVLLDDNFASIVGAIRMGRRIFDNLLKAFSFIIAVHIPILGLTLLPGFFSSLPVLLWPLHIVFLELIIDPVCSVAFESEDNEKDSMKRPPRNPDAKFFSSKIILNAAFQGLILLAMVLIVYYISINENHSEKEIRAITFAALIIGNVGLILTNLSKTRNVLSIILRPSLAIKLILAFAIGLLILILTVPFIQKVFSIESPPFIHFIPSIIGAATIVLIYETIKWRRNKNLKID